MNDQKTRVALLTIGSGPIATETYRYLAKHTDLRYVVFSKKKRKVSILQRVYEYGWWYALQALFARIVTLLSSSSLSPASIAQQNISSLTWRTKEDEQAVLAALRTEGVHTIIVHSFQHILSEKFIASFDYCLNIHPSLLPDYRGPEPIVWSILHKEKKYGLTLHEVTRGIDVGAIVHQVWLPSAQFHTIIGAENALAKLVPDLLEPFIKNPPESFAARIQQVEGGNYLPHATLHNRKNV
jgi:methionyl-tRNA formyltransferase